MSCLHFVNAVLWPSSVKLLLVCTSVGVRWSVEGGVLTDKRRAETYSALQPQLHSHPCGRKKLTAHCTDDHPTIRAACTPHTHPHTYMWWVDVVWKWKTEDALDMRHYQRRPRRCWTMWSRWNDLEDEGQNASPNICLDFSNLKVLMCCRDSSRRRPQGGTVDSLILRRQLHLRKRSGGPALSFLLLLSRGPSSLIQTLTAASLTL